MKAMPDREPLARTMICGKRYRSAYTRRFYVCNQTNGHRGACGWEDKSTSDVHPSWDRRWNMPLWAGTLQEEVAQRYAADALRRYHLGLHHASGNPDSNGW